jgi:hypothetical protein
VVVAVLARVVQPVRYANTALGGWLLVSTPLLEGLDGLTALNNLALGAAITVFSLLPRASASTSSKERTSRGQRDSRFASRVGPDQ